MIVKLKSLKEYQGFIGKHLAKKLLDRGDTVVGLDNINDYYDVNLRYGSSKVSVETVVADNSSVLPTIVGKITQKILALNANTPVAKVKVECRNTHINIGTGVDMSIKGLALTVYKDELHFNDTKPDGTMVKLIDPIKLHSLGWKHTTELEEGISI